MAPEIEYSIPAVPWYPAFKKPFVVEQPLTRKDPVVERLEAIEILLEKILARLPEVPARRVRAVELNKENFDE